MLKGLQQRVFIGDILDRSEDLLEIKLTLDEVVWENGDVEQQNEDFELAGEVVTYYDLVTRFGKNRIDEFVTEAIRNAR